MSASPNSRQIEALKRAYPADWPRPITPFRLGLLSGDGPIDYGAHSKRWIKLFEFGRSLRKKPPLSAA